MSREQVHNRFDQISYIFFLILIFFLPISIALFEIFSSFIIATYFIKRITLLTLDFKAKQGKPAANIWKFLWQQGLDGLKPVANPLRLAVGIFIYMNLLSVLASQYPALSWKGFFGKTFEAVFLFFSFVECMNSRQRLLMFTGVYLFSTALLSVDAFFQAWWGKDFLLGRPFSNDFRVTAAFKHPNDFGSFIVVGTVFALVLSLRTWLWIKKQVGFFVVSIIVFLLASIALGLTYSRGAWVGFFVGLLMIAFAEPRRFMIPLLIGIVFYLTFSTTLTKYRNVSFITDDIMQEGWLRRARIRAENENKLKTQPNAIVKIEVTPLNGTQVDDFQSKEYKTLDRRWVDLKNILSRFSGAGRADFWQEALHVFESSPIVGTGLNTYTQVAPRYKIHWGGYPHNCYLQMAAETGILGLGSFLWVVFLLYRAGYTAWRRITDPVYLALLVASITGLASFLVHGALDTNFYSVNLGNYMWIFMGFIIATIQTAKQESTAG